MNHHARNFMRLAQPTLQLLSVCIQIHRFLGHSALHRSLRHRNRLPEQHPRIERLRNQILRAKLHSLDSIRAAYRVRHIFFRQLCQRAGCRQLHLFIDCGRPHIQRPAKNKRESQNVVDLVRIVRSARRDDHIVPAAFASSYLISGSGFAIANTIGRGAIERIMSDD